MGLRLFDGSDTDNDDSKIEINRDYAKKFEHNKKREDLQRLEELKKKGLVEDSESDSSESELSSSDEEDNKKFMKKDMEFFNALIKIKKQDPTLKQKDVKLFDSDDSHGEESDKDGSMEKKKRSMYLKDVVAKHLMEEGPEFNNEETKNVKVYDKEQEEIRKAFFEAAEVQGEDDEEGLLKVKERGVVEEEKDVEFERKLDEYFGDGDDELDDNSKFLKEYFKNKLWLGEDRKVGEEEMAMLSDDEEEIEKQEEYEYRFQENAGDRILGHSRTIEGTVRKKKSSRKEQRKSKEERMEIARIEREEELKHLKNLKKEEVKEKLRKISVTAGIGEDEICLLDIKNLDEDFDPEDYDKMMKVAFGEEYYEKEDVDPEFGSDMDDEGDGEIEKPDFDKEDELLGLPKEWASSGSGDGFLAARERSLKHKIDNDLTQEDNEKEVEEHVSEEEKGKRKRKRKLSLYQKAKEAMMEEYYKLDYEDTIGDLKTRFKYAKIPRNRYGLSTAEIMAMDDKELNQFVSLKKLAPYKEEWKIPNSTRQRLKMRTKELLNGGPSGDRKGSMKRRKNSSDTHTSDDNENEKTQIEDSSGDKGNLSRKARRKLRRAEFKLSHSRLLAYGKITSKSKKKTKH
ncbi:protein KRI1 homolog [Momordica charantia]|uniref:Protein KRI1 homolog n=1 Tax=Momordica charantia TaxID=3673 RepID=A0A6J1DQ63_MOMCH|nr:protein KRI1 homolog [Momordica charantia]